MSFKAGFVALVGLPNAGKSTLLNALVGEKVGIISSKPQTTRKSVQGILTTKQAQMIFVDSPGLIRAETGINRFIEEESQKVIEDCDVLLGLLNLDEDNKDKLLQVVEILKASKKPKLALINKADLGKIKREAIMSQMLAAEGIEFELISAKKMKPEKVNALVERISGLLPESPGPLFDPEMYTTQTSKNLAAEVVREKCFEYLHQEIPFGLATQVLKFDESGKILKIAVDIIVSKENHRPMVIGAQGKNLKMIGRSARVDLETIYDQKVFLELFVKVRANWQKDDNWMKELGYVVEKKS